MSITDNASVDGTEAICRDYAARDTRIRYVRQQVNIGAASSADIETLEVLYRPT